MTDWRAVPKVELHLHLEGAAPPALIRTLAAEQGLDLSRIFTPDGSYAWDDFAGFLRGYEAACSVLTGPDAYARLTGAVLHASRADGVVYTEIFVCPHLCGGGDPGAWDAHLAAMQEAAAAVPGIETRFIATAIRHLGPEAAEAAARLAARPGSAGFGMAGEERHLTAADFARAYDIARDAGLALTVHAGEVCGAGSVRDVLDHLRPARIGHGVRAGEDADLVARLAAEGVVLEVCPGSNIALGVFADWASHPVARLDAAGVPVTLSSDDPPWFRTSLSQDYGLLSRTFGWGDAEFARLNRVAMQAAFCDEATRARILGRLEATP